MSALPTCAPPHPHVRAVNDGRPACHTWARSSPACGDQPTLAFDLEAGTALGPPKLTAQQVHAVRPPWSARPSALLPDAQTWSASLAQALVETLQGRRPVGQLSRWVDERVLATLKVALRHRQARVGVARSARPATLRSVHIQFPQPEAVEVSAHVRIGQRSVALAFRLEAWNDRWLCTALELGPREH